MEDANLKMVFLIPSLYKLFEIHCKSEFCFENMLFRKKIIEFKQIEDKTELLVEGIFYY
jgi:hypothetical protein